METFDARNQIEPFIVSDRIKKNNMNYLDAMKMLDDAYSQNKHLIDSLYGDFDYYKKRVSDCMLFPKGIVPIGTRIEEVDKDVFHLSKEPLDENIENLLTEVIEKYKDNFLPNFTRPEIFWTDRAVGSYYGMYYHDYNIIHINSLLNSNSVSKEVVKFVIYHECLHQEFKGHPKEFREKERKYDNFQEQEHFLNYMMRDVEQEFYY